MKNVIDLIENSDLNRIQKLTAKGFIERNLEREKLNKEDRTLIEQVANQKKISEVLYSTDEVKIYSVYGKGDWEVKYPIRSIFVDSKGKWRKNSTVAPTFEVAYLLYLQVKHLGDNSDFTEFALKMLEIKLEE